MSIHLSVPLSVYSFMLSVVRSFSDYLTSICAGPGPEPRVELPVRPWTNMTQTCTRDVLSLVAEMDGSGTGAQAGTVRGCPGAGDSRTKC